MKTTSSTPRYEKDYKDFYYNKGLPVMKKMIKTSFLTKDSSL